MRSDCTDKSIFILSSTSLVLDDILFEMFKKSIIVFLIFFISQALLADNLKNYKYKNYKKNTVKVNFDSIIPKMRAKMFDGKKIDLISLIVNSFELDRRLSSDLLQHKVKICPGLFCIIGLEHQCHIIFSFGNSRLDL